MANAPAMIAVKNAEAPPLHQGKNLPVTKNRQGVTKDVEVGIQGGPKNRVPESSFADVLDKVRVLGSESPNPENRKTFRATDLKKPLSADRPSRPDRTFGETAKTVPRSTAEDGIRTHEAAPVSTDDGVLAKDGEEHRVLDLPLGDGNEATALPIQVQGVDTKPAPVRRKVDESSESRVSRSEGRESETLGKLPHESLNYREKGGVVEKLTPEVTRSGKVEVWDHREPPAVEEKTPRLSSPVNKDAPIRIPTEAPPSSPTTLGDAPMAVAESEVTVDLSGKGSVTQENAAQALARKLDAQSGSDIVRQVKVILQRADAGEIRINLRPGDLGQVKMRIRLEDNRLAGRIIVESAAARDAFRAALDGLQTRLVESGFSAADLELSFEDSGRELAGEGQHQEQGGGDDAGAAEEFESMVAVAQGESINDSRVNLVV